MASQILLMDDDVVLDSGGMLCRFFLRRFPLRPAYSLGGSDSSSRSEGHPAARMRRKAAHGVIQAPYNPDCVIQLTHFLQHFCPFCLQLT
ncbi:MAG: hypothetical protein ACRD3L_08305 [Terriglobales bacterium]